MVIEAQFGSAARDRVDVLNRARQRQRRPGLSAILGAEYLALIARADIDLVRVGRMQRHRHDRSVDLHRLRTQIVALHLTDMPNFHFESGSQSEGAGWWLEIPDIARR